MARSLFVRIRPALSLLCTLLLLGSGCMRMEIESRTERGTLLRSYRRETLRPEHNLRLSVQTRWPSLILEVGSYKTCFVEDVDEYLEHRITQYEAPSAAPTLAAGASDVVAGVALWLSRNLFSSNAAPDSASPRQIATTASYVLVGLGLPAVVVGIVGLTQSGQRVEVGRTEEVVRARDVPCRPTPASGELTLVGPDTGDLPPLHLKEGKAEVDAKALRGHSLNGFVLDGRPVEVPAEAQRQLDAFEGCLVVVPPPSDEALAKAGTQLREVWRAAAEWCNTLPGAPAGPSSRYAPLPTRHGEESPPVPPPEQEPTKAPPPPTRSVPTE